MVANQHKHLNRTTVNIICDFFDQFKLQSLLNYSILVAKYFLYKCFLSEEPLNFHLFISELREHAPCTVWQNYHGEDR